MWVLFKTTAASGYKIVFCLKLLQLLSLTDDETGKLFILYSNNTEEIEQEDFTEENINNLLELSTIAFPELKRLTDEQLRDIVNAYITNYYLIR